MKTRRPAVAAVCPDTVSAASAQTRPPDASFAGRDALGRALNSGADWIWVVGRGAIPRPDALECLLLNREPPGESPASLLAGMVLDPSGTTLASKLPAGDERHPDVVRLVVKRALPIRSATFANCLVARECLVRHGLPDVERYGPYADVEWSSRVLRAHPGYLIPSSSSSWSSPGAGDRPSGRYHPWSGCSEPERGRVETCLP